MINHNLFFKDSLFYVEIPNPSRKSYEKYNIIQLIRYYTLLQRRKITSKFINNYFKYSHNLSFDDITYNDLIIVHDGHLARLLELPEIEV